MNNRTIEELKEQIQALTLEIELKQKEDELEAIKVKKTVRDTYNKKRQTSKTSSERKAIYKQYRSKIYALYLVFRGIATVEQLKYIDTDFNWSLFKEYELVKSIRFFDKEVFVLHAFTLNLMFKNNKEKTIRLSTKGLKKQLRRNNWNIKNFKHSGIKFNIPDGILKDRQVKAYRIYKKPNSFLLYNRVDLQMVLVDYLIKYKEETTKVLVSYGELKPNIKASKEQMLQLIKTEHSDWTYEKAFENVVYENKVEMVKRTVSQVDELFEIETEKKSIIASATKGQQFCPTDQQKKLSIVKGVGNGFELSKPKVETEKYYFLFDLFNDSFVNVNYVKKTNTLYLDFLDYTERVGRNRVKELINKVEMLLNVAYPDYKFKINIILNIHSNTSVCKRLKNDKEILEMEKAIKVNYIEFDYSL